MSEIEEGRQVEREGKRVGIRVRGCGYLWDLLWKVSNALAELLDVLRVAFYINVQIERDGKVATARVIDDILVVLVRIEHGRFATI